MTASVLAIALGASLGALLRWYLSFTFNSIFPTIPLGTLAANLIGGFCIGMFMGFTQYFPFVPQAARLGIVTGFLGGLTTFSTFSAETVNLFYHQEYLFSAVIIIAHVAGSLCATVLGIHTVKLFTS
jgi:CrcB protein